MADLQKMMARLGNQNAELEQRFAALAAEYAELHHVFAPFIQRYQQEVLSYHNELVALQRRIADLRVMLGDGEAVGPQSIETPLSRLVEKNYVPVEEQYARTWYGKEAPEDIEIDLDRMLPPKPERLDDLYFKIASRLHPLLAETPGEKAKRREMMLEVNRAYVHRQLAPLQAMADTVENRSYLPAIVNDEAVDALQHRVYLLEQAIMDLEGKIFDLRHGDVARVYAYARLVHKETGDDLLQNLNKALLTKLNEAKQTHDRLAARLNE